MFQEGTRPPGGGRARVASSSAQRRGPCSAPLCYRGPLGKGASPLSPELCGGNLTASPFRPNAARAGGEGGHRQATLHQPAPAPPRHPAGPSAEPRRPAGRADPAPGARAEPEGGGGCAGAPAPACPQRAGASSPAGSGWVRAGPASARGSARQERREPGRTGPSPHGRPEQPRGGRGRAGPASREPASGGPGLAAALGSRRGAKGAAAKLTTLAALSPEKQRLKQSPSPAALPGCDSGNRNGDAARKAR